MDGLELLRLTGEAASGDVAAGAMPDEALRFTLEYSAKPDIATELERIRALIGATNVSMQPLSTEPAGDLEHFLVLQIPMIVVNLSAKARFELANALATSLGLVSCEPDIGARVYAEPDARELEPANVEGFVVDLWCSSDATPPVDKRWALKSIGAPGAWALSPKQGQGIVVGQPDTGVATHPEIETGALALDKAANIIDGGENPTDPLSPKMANPGHGTATSSVVVSRDPGLIIGAAPGARVAPIRCINDVKIFNGAPVAAAVAHARKVGCDVISMSLGGIRHHALATAIRDAVNSGMIVVSAAGNCVGFVVYPASDDNVIAVAGVDEHDRPWKGTSAGSDVDIAGPAENVYVARRKPNDGENPEVSGGQGTSFATALAAGGAALWLAHHGKDKVRAEAANRGITVQALFRSALRRTARVPANWKPKKHGAGIIDAKALLELKLVDIPAPAPAGGIFDVETAGDRSGPDGAFAEIMRLANARQVVNGFDWAKHGAEATYLAARAEIISRRAQAGMETVGRGVLRPSAEVEATAPPVLRRLFGEAEIEGRAPAAAVMRPASANARLMKLIGKQAGGLESAASVSVETARSRLGGSHGGELLTKMEKALSALPESGDAAVQAERSRAVESAASAIDKFAREGVAATLSMSERIGIEALINIHDRPALRVRDGGIDSTDPLLGDWKGFLDLATAQIAPLAAAVGRVNLDGGHVGTGFVVASGVIVTNRHVLEAIAEEFRVADGQSRWAFTGDATINFAENGRGGETRFRIKSVIAAGPNRIDDIVNFVNLDMAVLEVETSNASGKPLPKSIKFVKDQTLVEERSEFLILGYPARPGANAMRDPNTGQIRDDVAARLAQIFGLAYSVKYLSPGEIDFPVGSVGGDARSWVFAHDATTLGGNSGSCVVHLGDPLGVIGLHFGGGALRANYAHGLVAVNNSGVLAKAGLAGVSWV